jgi:putative addiction module killer protein
MLLVKQTDGFKVWISALKDDRARTKILARVRRLGMGNPGDARPVGEGISEMRIDYGPGYRVYYKRVAMEVILLLCGGDLMNPLIFARLEKA